ncbi:MAG: Asp-tRNA(Asn)/Glu-tRNA(Gln) amidotransferase subunit GatA [Acidobacteriota bacterium]
MKNEIFRLSLEELNAAIRRAELSVREVCQAFLDRVQECESQVRAFLKLEGEHVLQQAGEIDGRLRRKEIEIGPLTGIPVAVKDVIITQGMETTCGSRILRHYIPPYDATVVNKLKQQGAVLFGKTNCDEFAMGSSTENSAYFPTHNPWDLTRVPGGSSGGSAACVGAMEAPSSLGTDTGGSIRQPAAFCGVVGLKPTYGRVSRYGLVAFASSLDQIGPLANHVRDVARLFQVLAGPDGRDSTCSPDPAENFLGQIEEGVGETKIGVPEEWFGPGLDPRIRASVTGALRRLEGLGCKVEEITLPHSEHAIATYYIIAPAEASSNLARYDGVKYGYRTSPARNLRAMYRETRSQGFGEEVKRRIMIGTYALSAGYYDAYYLKASQVRRLIRDDYEKAFEKVDLVVGPTTPTLPFRLGEKASDPLQMYLSDVYTVTANLAGIPALSLPCGFSENRLPIGIQLLGSHFQEAKLLRVARALEKDLDLERPPLARISHTRS